MPLFAIAALVAMGAGTPAMAKKTAELGPPSRAVTDEIVDAVAEEMDRAMAKLELPGAPKPYHISYKITEVEVNDAVASLGHVTNKKARHFVNLECRVRVKVDGLDNGNFVVPRAEQIDGTAGISLALEATPRIARRAAWLVTDTAYKEALVQLRAKLDARTAGGVGQSTIPSWTDEPAVVAEEQVRVAPLESLEEIVARAEKISAVFRGNPDIRDSRVAFTTYLERRWYLTSEGTSATDTRRASGVIIVASGQAQDGQAIESYYSKYGHTAADLPRDEELEKEAKAIGGHIVALATAPVVDRYTGPVLFEGAGAAGIVRYSLAPHLGGTPLPEGLSAQEAKLFGGALTDKVGLKVVATMLSIVDDPTAAFSAGKAIIGGYKTDDEGVAAQRVEVVEDGMLRSLLTTRTPASEKARSNGHARRTTKGGAFHGSATNLMLSIKRGLTAAALKKKLIAEVRAAGLPYGLIIRRLDDSAITAARELSRRELIQVIANADLTLPPPAVLAYRVYPSGKEELVRGVQLAEVPVRAWRDVVAGSKSVTVANYLASPEGYLEHEVGGVDEGFVPTSGIESSVTTPDLLFKELDVVPSTLGLRARPLVGPPGK